jgi:branched-chain amino acid aminotransferase
MQLLEPNMVQKTDVIWFDGKLIPWDEANVHVLTHTLHYGVGVFEGIRAYELTGGGSAVFRLEEHMQRFEESAKILHMKMPFSVEETVKAVIDTLTTNKMTNGYIRPVAFIGEGAMGVHPQNNPIRVAIVTWPWGAYLGAEALEKGISIATSSYVRHHVNIMMTKSKCAGNYVNSVLAKMEAVANGYDEALLLDPDGYVAEGSGENIFLVRKGKLITPPLTSILEGLTRDAIMSLAVEMGLTVEEQRFTRDTLYTADEAFFTGTAAEITPIREADRRVIGQGKAGPVTKAFQDAFFKIVAGENPAYDKWRHRYAV